MTLAFAQLFHLANARSDAPLMGRAHTSNPYALMALALSIGLQLLAAYLAPLARVLGVQPLDGRTWFLVVSLAIMPALIGQAIKIGRRRRGVGARRR
jgi:Ca2+-transporting ATPase